MGVGRFSDAGPAKSAVVIMQRSHSGLTANSSPEAEFRPAVAAPIFPGGLTQSDWSLGPRSRSKMSDGLGPPEARAICAPSLSLIASEVHLTWQAAIGAVQVASVIRDLLRRR